MFLTPLRPGSIRRTDASQEAWVRALSRRPIHEITDDYLWACRRSAAIDLRRREEARARYYALWEQCVDVYHPHLSTPLDHLLLCERDTAETLSAVLGQVAEMCRRASARGWLREDACERLHQDVTLALESLARGGDYAHAIEVSGLRKVDTWHKRMERVRRRLAEWCDLCPDLDLVGGVVEALMHKDKDYSLSPL